METMTPAKPVVIGIGAVVALLGLIMLGWGLAPAKGFAPAMEVFGGGTPPPDLSEQIEAAMDELTARAWASGLGFVGILGGIITITFGKPQPIPADKLIEAALGNQVTGAPTSLNHVPGGQPASPASSPAAAPAPAAPPVPAPAPRAAAPSVGGAACPKCQGPLIMGGTYCKKHGRV